LDHHRQIGAGIWRRDSFDIERQIVALDEHCGRIDRGQMFDPAELLDKERNTAGCP
jgi:hypothetical protein